MSEMELFFRWIILTQPDLIKGNNFKAPPCDISKEY